MSLDELMTRFRLESREFFNREFRVVDSSDNDKWTCLERFKEVQEVLFQKLVVEPASLPTVSYGEAQASISVELREGMDVAPILLNRDLESGYWDYPVTEITRTAELCFVCFFDWDQLSVRDNQYTRVQVRAWPEHPQAIGKHALIDSQHVRFIRKNPS